MYAFSRPLRTPDGLRWTTYAFFAYFGFLAVQIVIGVVYAVLLSNLLGGGFPDLGAIAAVIGLGIAAFVLGIVVLVFYFLGFGYLYAGRHEFGPDHARNMRLALILVVTAIAMGVAAVIVPIVVLFATFAADPFAPPNPNAILLSVILQFALSAATAALVAATLVYAVRVLANPDHGGLLLLGAGVGTATPIVVAGLTVWQLSEVLRTGFTGGGFSVGLPQIVGATLGFVAIGLFLVAYRGAAERIRTGQLRPVAPPPTPFVSWMPQFGMPPPPTPPGP